MEIHLEAGLRAYPVELANQAPGVGWRELRIPTIDEAQNKLNTLLQAIKEQGGEFKGFVTITTGEESRSTIGGRAPETTTFVIVEKGTEQLV